MGEHVADGPIREQRGAPCLFVSQVGEVIDQASVRGAGSLDGGIALLYGAVHERIIAAEP